MTPRARIDPPLCVALDAPDLERAHRLLKALRGVVPVFKVGLELFCATGLAAVDLVRKHEAEVFLDLKVNDIPNQTAGAVVAAGRAGAGYLTIHANAGRPSLRAAVQARPEGLRLLVVSVLTSLDQTGLAETGITRSVSDQVQASASLASEEGADGLVLSTVELERVRGAQPDLLLVTPGIRPDTAERGDQRRVGTPEAAIAAGADLLVVGRPITESDDPLAAAERILGEIHGVASSARA